MSEPDDWNEYLAGGSALSRAYRREAAPLPCHALDRAVLEASRLGAPRSGAQGSGAQRSGGRRLSAGKSQYLAPLAFAASVLLSFAMVLAIVFAPRARHDGAPKLLQVRLYSDTATRKPAVWLAEIAALRRAGRYSEAAAEMRRFRIAHPNYIIPSDE
jgi:hypothetical protein